MASFILGFTGLLISFVAIFFTLVFPKKPEANKVILSSIIAFILGLILFFIINSFTTVTSLEVPLWEAIVFTLLITPLFEELLYRRIILQYFINIEKFKFEHVLKTCLAGIFLVLPTILFLQLGWVYDNHKIFLLLIPFFMILPSLLVLLYNRSNRINFIFYLVMILVFQAFVFLMMHGDYAAWTLIIVGLLYGTLYLITKSIVPPLTAHYTINLLILLKQLNII